MHPYYDSFWVRDVISGTWTLSKTKTPSLIRFHDLFRTPSWVQPLFWCFVLSVVCLCVSVRSLLVWAQSGFFAACGAPVQSGRSPVLQRWSVFSILNPFKAALTPFYYENIFQLSKAVIWHFIYCSKATTSDSKKTHKQGFQPVKGKECRGKKDKAGEWGEWGIRGGKRDQKGGERKWKVKYEEGKREIDLIHSIVFSLS